MTQKTHRSLTAGSAIAAALALAPFPVLAQDVIVPTIEAAPAAPPPAMPAPAPASEPTMVSSPVVQEAPPEPVASPEPAAAEAPATTTRSTPAAVRQAAPVRATTVAAPDPAAPVAAPVTIEEPVPPVAPIAAAPADATAVPAAPDTLTPASDPTRALLPILLAAIVFAALAIWAFVAIGRRRRPYTAATAPVVERPVVTPPQPQPVAAQPIVAQPVAERVTPLASPRPAEGLAHTGAAVALPRQLPASYAERDALLRRMVAAKPDRANPFRSPKARARRARLILGSLGRDFSQVEPRIDLSQYQANWPSLARNKSAAA